MTFGEVPIADAYAEAFDMVACRVIVTAASPRWALAAAQAATGFATSIIRCDVEAGIERELIDAETPDGRPGVSMLFFARTFEKLAQSVIHRIGQGVLTCATTACFNGLSKAEDSNIRVGEGLSCFGDGFQTLSLENDHLHWIIPVMDGQFLCEDEFGTTPAIGGGNFLILAGDLSVALAAAEAAANAARAMPDVILPFPLGVVRSGSKVGSQYPGLGASINHRYCPTLRDKIEDSALPLNCNAVYEIVIDGLTHDAVANAMRAGIQAACIPGVLGITAGNYEGKLGPHKFHLRELMKAQ